MANHAGRRTPEMEISKALVARIMKETAATPMDMAGVLNCISRLSEDGLSLEDRLPEETNARTFLQNHLVRKGALERGPDGLFASPIPCFRRFLMREGGLAPDG